jgi:hypothetical protein
MNRVYKKAGFARLRIMSLPDGFPVIRVSL